MITRWLCEKCRRKWAYPIDSCAYCNALVKKQRGTKIKIVGMTTVSIPSTNHPVVPYHVALLEDEFGSRMPKKTMGKLKVGDSFSFSGAKTGNAVAIMRLKYDVEEDVYQALSLLKGVDIKASDKVFIKVSCVEPSTQQGAYTSPRILGSVITWLRKKGVEDIVVGEQSLLGDSADAASKAGIVQMCKTNGVSFIDISKESFVEKDIEGVKVRVAKSAIERKVINIPVMNTHVQYGVAGALENLMRLLDAESQKAIHKEGIAKMLPKLAALFPVLSIGDASVAMQNFPPGEPVFMRLVCASSSPLALDRIFSEIGMLPAPNYLKGIKTREIEIVGEGLDCVKAQLKGAHDGSLHPYVRFVGDADPKCFMGAVSACRKLIGAGSSGATIQLAMGAFTKDMLDEKIRIVLYGKDAVENGKKLDVVAVAELTEEMPELQRIVLLRAILEDPQKKRIGVADMFKIKMAEFVDR